MGLCVNLSLGGFSIFFVISLAEVPYMIEESKLNSSGVMTSSGCAFLTSHFLMYHTTDMQSKLFIQREEQKESCCCVSSLQVSRATTLDSSNYASVQFRFRSHGPVLSSRQVRDSPASLPSVCRFKGVSLLLRQISD